MITNMLSYVNIKLIRNKPAFVSKINENIQSKKFSLRELLKDRHFYCNFS